MSDTLTPPRPAPDTVVRHMLTKVPRITRVRLWTGANAGIAMR